MCLPEWWSWWKDTWQETRWSHKHLQFSMRWRSSTKQCGKPRPCLTKRRRRKQTRRRQLERRRLPHASPSRTRPEQTLNLQGEATTVPDRPVAEEWEEEKGRRRRQNSSNPPSSVPVSPGRHKARGKKHKCEDDSFRTLVFANVTFMGDKVLNWAACVNADCLLLAETHLRGNDVRKSARTMSRAGWSGTWALAAWPAPTHLGLTQSGRSE